MAKWTTEYINNLSDLAFAYIEDGGTKDADGKTVPRSLRHLPYKDEAGNVDAEHVRNALARLPQTDISDAAKAAARKKLVAAAKKVGVTVADESKKVLAIPFEYPFSITKTYVDGEKWFIEGYAGSTELDLVGDIITEEAFKLAENDLVGNSTVLYNHDPEQSIGKIEEVKAMPEGLWIKALISQTEPDIWQKIKEGVLNKFSIRGRVVDAVKKFIKDIGKVVNVINEIYLIEASLVALPANPEAKALCWYVSKSLTEFESKGGEIPIEHADNNMLNGGTMTISELMKQINDRLVADEDKALLATLQSEVEKSIATIIKKKSGEAMTQSDIDVLEKSITDLQAALDLEKQKKPKKPIADEMQDDEMKEIIALADEIRKKFPEKFPKKPEDEVKPKEGVKKSTGEEYTQIEVDTIAKELSDTKAKVETLLKELNDLKADTEVAKRWDNLKNEYDNNDATLVKSILKKSVTGIALTVDETEQLVTKKLSSSQLRVAGGKNETEIKNLDAQRREDLIKKGGIRVRLKSS